MLKHSCTAGNTEGAHLLMLAAASAVLLAGPAAALEVPLPAWDPQASGDASPLHVQAPPEAARQLLLQQRGQMGVQQHQHQHQHPQQVRDHIPMPS